MGRKAGSNTIIARARAYEQFQLIGIALGCGIVSIAIMSLTSLARRARGSSCSRLRSRTVGLTTLSLSATLLISGEVTVPCKQSRGLWSRPTTR